MGSLTTAVRDRVSDDERAPSGAQYAIRFGEYRAEVSSVGASLRTLTFAGRNLVAPFDIAEIRPVFRGTVLVPWPNRIADGRYTFEGHTHQLALTEPDRGNALHGLAVWADWTVVQHTENSVSLQFRVVPQAGYPFDVMATTTYTLTERGLDWSITAHNLGSDVAPYGLGSHAYLVAGPGQVDQWQLSLPAASVLEVTSDRLLPVTQRAVSEFAEGALDFQKPRIIGDVFIDHAYTAVTANDDHGTTTVTLMAADAKGVGMQWNAEELPWVQIHTADRPEPRLHRSGLAVEPMSCAPDAFNSGDGLIRLAPGAKHTGTWRIFAVNAGLA